MSGVGGLLDRKIRRRESRAASRIEHVLWTEPGPPGALRPPDMQPDPVVVPEVRPGTDGGDQEAEAASHDAGAADGPEQRADPEREDAEDAFIDDDDDDDDDNELEDSPQKTLLAAMAKRLQAELSSRGTLTDD